MALMPNEPDLVISSLRGGLNAEDALSALAPNECAIAENVEFFYSELGERRLGCEAFDLTGSGLTDEDVIAHLSQWFATNQVDTPEWWAIGITPGTSSSVARYAGGGWTPVTPNDAIVTAAPDGYGIVSQSLNGKLHWAYRSAEDRMHLWDGTQWIRSGLAQPDPPTASNESATAYATTRYFRVRAVTLNVLDQVTRRSSVSPTLTFAPSGAAQGVLIAMPPLLGEGETNWELEASVDNTNFYLLSLLDASELTYFDTTVFATGYAAGTASAAVTGEPFTTPQAPKAKDGGFSDIRYYRVRYTTMDGTVVVRRSEPSESLTFTPSGTAKGVTVTKPAAINESETHWELEASDDNADFYVLTTLPIATTTYNDETFLATSYADGVLSEDVGEYLTLPAAKFLAVDADHLLLAGHQTDLTAQSRVMWTLPSNAPGAGNDERLPASVNNTIDLDNYEGGPLTGICAAANGIWYAFKWSHIYILTRTGDANRAYAPQTLSKKRGAIPGSVFGGVDETGAACVFFYDPLHGPSRIGPGGLQRIRGLRTLLQRVNLKATAVIARGLYYPVKHQAHWWLAVDGNDSPNLRIISQVSELRPHPKGGLSGGWSTATGRSSEAYAVALLSEWETTAGGVSTLADRPFIGLTDADYIQRMDVGDTDAGETYRGHIRTGPYLVKGLLNRWGAMKASLLAAANASRSLLVTLIRDFGVETSTAITVTFVPASTEDPVIKDFDNLRMSSARGVQVDFIDPA